MSKKFVILYEKGKSGYGAYAPDLPGCIAVGKNLRRVKKLMKEAVGMHVASMREHGELVPQPTIVATETVVVRNPRLSAAKS